MKAVIYEEDPAIIRTFRQVGEVLYERILFKTHFIKPGEDMVEVISRYAKGYLQEGDIVFVSDKALANSQQRAIHIDDVKPGFFARILCRFVYSSAAGRGIGTPQKMQVAIEQVGLLRILLGAFLSFITKIFGIRGVFYKIVGEKVRGIDGMSGGPKGPYWEYIILPSGSPSQVAEKIFQKTGCHAIVADINDLDGHIMGYSADKLKELDFKDILRDNPMGQENTQTPIGIIRAAQAAVAAG
jgi:hypothetical protein